MSPLIHTFVPYSFVVVDGYAPIAHSDSIIINELIISFQYAPISNTLKLKPTEYSKQ